MCFMCCKNRKKEKQIDTLTKLAENFSETTGFYKMVKRQTWISLCVAVTFLIIGLIVYAVGFFHLSESDNYMKMSVISGSMVELIAGTAFWLHNKTIEELNEFHKRLNSTERYLTAITLADKIEDRTRKEDSYRWILENCILTDVEIQTGEILNWRHEKRE